MLPGENDPDVNQQFRETAAPDLRAHPDPNVLHIGSFMWARPYIKLTPEACFVLDNGTGTAVGYVLGAPNTPAFVERFRNEFFQYAKEQGIVKPDNEDTKTDLATRFRRDVYTPENMLHTDFPNLIKQYPAHLHIDILPSHQSQGWGVKLLNALFEKLKDQKVPGLYLGMVADNHRARKFYDRLGFEAFSEMNEKGEVGRKENALYLVKSI